MDVLSDILSSLHLKGGVYFRCDFSAPWGMEIKPTPVAEFHLITRGQCWLRVPSRPTPIPLHSGDVVVFPHGDAHTLLDAPGSEAVPAEKIVAGQNLDHYGPVVYGGDGLPAGILCGYFEFDREARHPLIAALPPVIHIRGTDTHDFAWLQTAITFIAQETREPRPGGDAVVNRLAEVLFIQILRVHIERAEMPLGLLAAIADKQIGAALAHLHNAPEKPWSVASLANRVAMSRSAFAARFARLVGQSPMDYLARRRMDKARELLEVHRMSVAAVAEKVGYRSEAAFGKAFKKIVGTGPGAFRRKPSPQA
ncbi:MAG: AraC family transcriptional regulator [Betaproteobacteria bacterium]|nr:AraC family transcriptional regulator [Betaproteobacteria bacterium]